MRFVKSGCLQSSKLPDELTFAFTLSVAMQPPSMSGKGMLGSTWACAVRTYCLLTYGMISSNLAILVSEPSPATPVMVIVRQESIG